VLMTAALMLAALGAHAEMPQMLGTDPLSRQILTKTAQENGGVTAVVSVSGKAVKLELADVSSAPFTAKMAPPASDTALYLHPAEGLVAKPVKAKTKKAPKHAVDQLKRVSAAKSWVEKP